MPTAIYARKSTESEDRQVQSLEDQLKVMRQIAERENLDVAEVLIESRSAKEPGTRPEFQRLMDAINRGEIDGILTWHINRLSRNMVDGGTLAHLLHAGKLKFIRTSDRLYLPEDNVLLLAIENGMATSYVHDLSKAVKRGMTGKADRGWMPGQAPLGYLNNPWTKEIDPDPVRFPLVELGWQMLLRDRVQVSQIHRRLTELGLTSHMKSTKGQPYSLSAMYAIFRNPFYAGHFTRNGVKHQGRHKPMITMAQFEEAQDIMASPRGKYCQQRFNHAYAGVFHCARCGCKMTPTKAFKSLSDGSTRAYTYYHCTGNRGCSRRSTKEHLIDQTVKSVIDRVSIPEDFGQWCQAIVRREFLHSSSIAEYSSETAKAALTKSKARLDRLMALYLDGELSRDEFHEAQPRLKAEVTRLEKQSRLASDLNEQIAEWISQKLDAGVRASKYEMLDLNTRRATLMSLGENHLLEGETVRIDLDPIVEKIAAIKPMIPSSQSKQFGGQEASISFWLRELKEIWKLAEAHVLQRVGVRADDQPTET